MNDDALSSGKVKVQIYNQNYTIEGDARPEYILQVAEYVDLKMREIAKSSSGANPLQIAILAAMNIADELFQLKNSEYDLSEKIINKANMLISMLDEGLIGEIDTIK